MGAEYTIEIRSFKSENEAVAFADTHILKGKKKLLKSKELEVNIINQDIIVMPLTEEQ